MPVYQLELELVLQKEDSSAPLCHQPGVPFQVALPTPLAVRRVACRLCQPIVQYQGLTAPYMRPRLPLASVPIAFLHLPRRLPIDPQGSRNGFERKLVKLVAPLRLLSLNYHNLREPPEVE